MYSGCDQFEDQCQRCPILKAPFDRFLARREWGQRSRALWGKRLFIVGNSQWTTQMAMRASLFRNAASITTIRPGVNPAQFHPKDKRQAKQLLGVDPENFVLGFGCADLTDPNKGFTAFCNLVSSLSPQINLDVVVFGNGLANGELAGRRLHTLGRIESPELLSLAFSAMDVYVLTSEMETFGQVAIEAQSCGTPVCAFAVGGVADAISDGNTGFLVPFDDMAALVDRVVTLIHDSKLREEMGRAGRRRVCASFSMESVADAYIRLYEQALGDDRHRNSSSL
jgi:glycosyltransferase involved in cell wall biosynthesis